MRPQSSTVYIHSFVTFYPSSDFVPWHFVRTPKLIAVRALNMGQCQFSNFRFKSWGKCRTWGRKMSGEYVRGEISREKCPTLGQDAPPPWNNYLLTLTVTPCYWRFLPEEDYCPWRPINPIGHNPLGHNRLLFCRRWVSQRQDPASWIGYGHEYGLVPV